MASTTRVRDGHTTRGTHRLIIVAIIPASPSGPPRTRQSLGTDHSHDNLFHQTKQEALSQEPLVSSRRNPGGEEDASELVAKCECSDMRVVILQELRAKKDIRRRWKR